MPELPFAGHFANAKMLNLCAAAAGGGSRASAEQYRSRVYPAASSSTFTLDLTRSLLSPLTTFRYTNVCVCVIPMVGSVRFLWATTPLAMKAFPHPPGLPNQAQVQPSPAQHRLSSSQPHGVHFNFCFVYNLRDTTSIKCLAGKAHTCTWKKHP